LDDNERTLGRVAVSFEDERGQLLQDALLIAVPRVGEEVQLRIFDHKVDQDAIEARLKQTLPKLGFFKRLKLSSKVLFGVLGLHEGPSPKDMGLEEKDMGLDDVKEKVLEGTIVRVVWRPVVISPEIAVTCATVVVKLRDGTSQG
jgi:hypothetical protein